MENLIISLKCVLPMFIIICTGIGIRKMKIVPDSLFNDLSRMTFRTLLPMLVFYNIYAADITGDFHPSLLGYLATWLIVWFILNYILFTVTIKDPKSRGAYIQNAYRTNIAVIGVALAQAMMDSTGIASVTMGIAVMVPIFNVTAVITLETCRGGSVDFKRTLVGIMKNPLIPSCLLGLIFLGLGVRLPGTVDKALSQMGNAGSVLILITLGATIKLDGIKRNLKKLVFLNGYRLVIAPLSASLIGLLLGFRGQDLGAIVICTAAPMASSAYPMALACDSDYELTAQIIATTSFFCSFTLFLWIFVLKQLGLM